MAGLNWQTRWRRTKVGAILLLGFCLAGSAVAQTGEAPRLVFAPGTAPSSIDGSEEASEPQPLAAMPFSPLTPREPFSDSFAPRPTAPSRQALPAAAAPIVEHMVRPASCSTCSSGLIGGALGHGGCSSCGGGCGSCSACGSGPRQPCYPGQSPRCQHHSEHDGPVARFLGGIYDCICCPDPCYDPRWIPLADSAFFAASARPVTQTRFRWNNARHVVLPDRAEFFWARADGNGKGPTPNALLGVNRLHYNELVQYTEAGTGTITAIVETPYRSVDPEFAPYGSGFSDMRIGTKTLLFDCELLQVSLQFLTYLPVGNARKGLGTGHVSLEPSLLFGVKLTPSTYLQSQVSEWIPLGGDPDYAGAVLHTHTSVNQLIWCHPSANLQLIGTLELNTWSFQDGAYTDPNLGMQGASGDTYFSGGPGLRFFICDKIDIGFATMFGLSDPTWARFYSSLEFRFRF